VRFEGGMRRKRGGGGGGMQEWYCRGGLWFGVAYYHGLRASGRLKAGKNEV